MRGLPVLTKFFVFWRFSGPAEMAMHQTTVMTLDTKLGWVAVLASPQSLFGITLGHLSEPQAIGSLLSTATGDNTREGPIETWHEALMRRIRDFTQAKRVDFDDIPLYLDPLSPFQRRVVRECRKIRFGETLAYSQLAARAGSPRAARAVGTVMAKNRFPIVVPCHRVIGSDGTYRGFSAPKGVELKRRMLALEGRARLQHGSKIQNSSTKSQTNSNHQIRNYLAD
jgi:methylated-DNA-[protein]-cysteine S-methyltransferase